MAARFLLGGTRASQNQNLTNLSRSTPLEHLPSPAMQLTPQRQKPMCDQRYFPTRVFSSTPSALAGSDTGFTTVSALKMNNERQPYTTTATIRDKHVVVADEPSSLGGADLGPNPYELLLAALGACTNITTAMYARFVYAFAVAVLFPTC